METYIVDSPDSPLSVMRLFSITQSGIDTFSDQLIHSVQGGEVNALEMLAMCKSLEMILERVKKETKENQLRAAELHPGEKFTAYGVEFVKADVYTSYDFKDCGDPIWEQREQIAASAKEQLKERETFLKTIKGTMTVVIEETGEAVTIKPPVKKSVAGLKLSIK